MLLCRIWTWHDISIIITMFHAMIIKMWINMQHYHLIILSYLSVQIHDKKFQDLETFYIKCKYTHVILFSAFIFPKYWISYFPHFHPFKITESILCGFLSLSLSVCVVFPTYSRILYVNYFDISFHEKLIRKHEAINFYHHL